MKNEAPVTPSTVSVAYSGQPCPEPSVTLPDTVTTRARAVVASALAHAAALRPGPNSAITVAAVNSPRLVAAVRASAAGAPARPNRAIGFPPSWRQSAQSSHQRVVIGRARMLRRRWRCENAFVAAVYDRIGTTYGATRRPDPRIAAAILEALGGARSVVNVGAGAGSYEPTDREVLAVEPSATMIAQRPPTAAPALQASAESLPLPDDSFDAALAVNTVQHWSDLAAGLRELRRVARQRAVVFVQDPSRGSAFWLADYLPGLDGRERMATIIATIERELAPVAAVPVPLPRDCRDGFFDAYWARPQAYLDDAVRRNISNFALADARSLAEGLARLEADLSSGAWDLRYGTLRSLPEIDLGYRLLIGETTNRTASPGWTNA